MVFKGKFFCSVDMNCLCHLLLRLYYNGNMSVYLIWSAVVFFLIF